MARVCLDAGLVLELLLRQRHADAVEALWAQWRQKGTELVGPPMLFAEVPSVIREAVYFKRMTAGEGDEAFEIFCHLGIRPRYPPDLFRKAWELGKAFNAHRLYDLHYVALADLEECELWTADQRLLNLVQGHPARVRWVGEASSTSGPRRE